MQSTQQSGICLSDQRTRILTHIHHHLKTEDLHLIGYPWDQITLTLNWTRFTPLDVSLPLPAANQK